MAEELRVVCGFAHEVRHDVGEPHQLFDGGVEVGDVGGEDGAGGGRVWGGKVCAEGGSELGLFGGCVGEDLGCPG